MTANIKYNYNLSVDGLMTIDGDAITVSVEDGGDYSLASLCEYFNGKVVKIIVTYDKEYK